MKVSTKTFVIFLLFIVTKISITYAIDYEDYDDDDELSNLIADILTLIVSALFGACSETPECSSIMWPTIMIIGILSLCISCCCINNDDYEYDHRPRRIRFRSVAAAATGYTLGKYAMKR